MLDCIISSVTPLRGDQRWNFNCQLFEQFNLHFLITNTEKKPKLIFSLCSLREQYIFSSSLLEEKDSFKRLEGCLVLNIDNWIMDP